MKTKKLTLLLTAAMFLMGADYHERTIAQIVDISLGTCCPLHEQRLLVSCSPVPHHVVPEGPLGEHGWNSV